MIPKTRAFFCALLLSSSLSSGVIAEGVGGLSQAIDTPRSADSPADELSIALDYREDYRALAFTFQPSDRFEIGISFPTYDDGSGSSSGNELSFGLRLLDESRYGPGLSVGIVGFGSDDRGSGEYVLASKTIGAVQASIGLGWGRYAQNGTDARGDDDGVVRARRDQREQPAFRFSLLHRGERMLASGLAEQRGKDRNGEENR